MDHKSEESTAPPSLLMLNEYCLLYIFELINELEDSVNLASSCSRLRFVGNRFFRRHSILGLWTSVDSKILNKDEEYIDYILSSIGEHVSLLELDGRYVLLEFSKIISKISNECKNLKCLRIMFWEGNSTGNVTTAYSFDNVQLLTIQLHQSDVNSLLKFNQLTKIELDCMFKNIDDFLRELAKKGFMEEMDLCRVDTNEDFFDILASFEKLKLLILGSIQLKSSIAWPTKLIKLQLIGVLFRYDDFISIIQQLHNLTSIDVFTCYTLEGHEQFDDVKKMSEQILHIMIDRNRKQRLDVVLPEDAYPLKDPSKKYVFDSEHLRIFDSQDFETSYNPLEIEVNFPGIKILYHRTRMPNISERI